MKKTILIILGLLIIGGGIYFYYIHKTNYNFESDNQNMVSDEINVYKNEKFGYEVSLPVGWYVLDESSDKENVILTNNINPVIKEDMPWGPDRIVISMSTSNIEEPDEASSVERILKKIRTENGYNGFIRIDNYKTNKGTIGALSFSSQEKLITNGDDKQPKSIMFLISGKIDEKLMMYILNSFKKI